MKRTIYVCNVASPEIEPLIAPVLDFSSSQQSFEERKEVGNDEVEPLTMPKMKFGKE